MFRVSVKKGLLFFSLLLGLFSCSYWVWQCRRQQLLVEEILDSGGIVLYDYELDGDGELTEQPYPEHVPQFLVQWLGDDYFCEVHRVDVFQGQFPLDKLSVLTKLKKLSTDQSVTPSLQNIDRFQRLESFEWMPGYGMNAENPNWSVFAKLKALKSISVASWHESILEHLDSSPNLNCIKISGLDPDEIEFRASGFGYYDETCNPLLNPRRKQKKPIDLRLIQSKSDLEKLVIHGNKIPDLSSLKLMESLEWIDLSGVNNADLTDIENNQNLETLGFGFSFIERIEKISSFKKLKRLVLTNCRINWDKSPVVFPDSLQTLVIQDCGLKSLRSLELPKGLKKICLNENNIDSVDCLLDLPNLEIVMIKKNNRPIEISDLRKKASLLKLILE